MSFLSKIAQADTGDYTKDLLSKVNAVRQGTRPAKEPLESRDFSNVLKAIRDLKGSLQQVDGHDHKVIVMLNGVDLVKGMGFDF